MILRTDKAGLPAGWLSYLDAATLMVGGKVVWTYGEVAKVLRGGVNAQGVISGLEIPSVLATEGETGHMHLDRVPHLNNHLLFSRDGFMCMYCGKSRQEGALLTRDHITPKGYGGEDK